MLTGESLPADKGLGDDVFGATINVGGALRVQATKVGQDTALAQIVKLVADAQGNKAPIQKLADRVSGIFVPIVLLIAGATAVIWYLVTGDLYQSLIPAVAVLVIACPCSLGLATPTAIMVGTGLAARRGILIKNGEALERGEKIDIVLFDKTGTLTQGKPRVVAVLPSNGTEDDLLRLAASAEQLSEHPLARAIVMAAREKSLPLAEPAEFANLAGKGVRTRLESADVLIGSPRLLNEEGITFSASEAELIATHEAQGRTVVGARARRAARRPHRHRGHAQVRCQGCHCAACTSQGLRTAMITGDNEAAARSIARDLGIDRVFAQVLPQEKVQKVRELQAEGARVAFVGDGINDAPALAQADLGIAMGTGTDIAIEAGNIVLVKGSPLKMVEALGLSQADVPHHPAEPVLGIFLQCGGHPPGRSWLAQSDDRCRCHGDLQY